MHCPSLPPPALPCQVMDESGEVLVQVFNEQAEQLLGMKADELADIREAGGSGCWLVALFSVPCAVFVRAGRGTLAETCKPRVWGHC